MINDYFPQNDDLDAVINSPKKSEARALPEGYKTPEQRFEEPCNKCGGSGKWRGGYTNLVIRACFTCKGTGKHVFKTSFADRAKAKHHAQVRKEVRADELMTSVKQFEVDHPEVYKWMFQPGQTFPFAVSLRDALIKYGELTEKQLAAAYRSVEGLQKAIAKRAERDASAPAITIERIEQAFQAARDKGLSKLRLRLANYIFTPAKEGSKNVGAIYVKEGTEYLGKIMGGKFFAVRECGDERQAEIVATAADPAAAARAYGLRTGSCSCCGRELSDPESIKLGIGPICASKWGL